MGGGWTNLWILRRRSARRDHLCPIRRPLPRGTRYRPGADLLGLHHAPRSWPQNRNPRNRARNPSGAVLSQEWMDLLWALVEWRDSLAPGYLCQNQAALSPFARGSRQQCLHVRPQLTNQLEGGLGSGQSGCLAGPRLHSVNVAGLLSSVPQRSRKSALDRIGRWAGAFDDRTVAIAAAL
jgi:hypothetical protein